VRISKRLALAISGAAFVGTTALTLGVAAPAGAAVSAPATAAPQGLGNNFFCGGGFFNSCCCNNFFDDFDDCD
jgi:hypothetical protein